MIKQRGYTVFDVFSVFGFVAGVVIAGKYGHASFGLAGGLVGAVIGGFIGLLAGRLPYVWVSYFVLHSLERESNRRLRERLRSGKEYYGILLILGELMRRGEDVRGELTVVVDLMKSDTIDRRRFGWAALKYAFPEVASEVSEYRPTESAEKCRAVASRIEGPLQSSNR